MSVEIYQRKTVLFLETHLNLVPEVLQLFHYTDSDSASSILRTREFHASFLADTKDKKEFIDPMNVFLLSLKNLKIRPKMEWILVGLCQNVDEQITSPKIVPHFVSFSNVANNSHLKKIYGDSILRLDFRNFSDPGLPFLVKPIYTPNPKKKIADLFSQWAASIDFNYLIENLETSEWLPALMQFMFIVSCGIKDIRYQAEDEVRMVFMVDQEKSEGPYFGPFAQKKTNQGGTKTYLPIWFEKEGAKISLQK